MFRTLAEKVIDFPDAEKTCAESDLTSFSSFDSLTKDRPGEGLGTYGLDDGSRLVYPMCCTALFCSI